MTSAIPLQHLATKLVHICMTAYICSSYIYDFYIFAVVYSPLGGFIQNQHNDQLPAGLLAY